MELKLTLNHPHAVIPSKSNPDDIGQDLTAVSSVVDDNGLYIEYDTGISVEPPEGYYFLVYPRSSVTRKDLFLKNSVGVIDPGYRGTIKLRYSTAEGIGCFSFDQTTLEITETADSEVLTSFNFKTNIIEPEPNVYKPGDKIGQLVLMKQEDKFATWSVKTSLTETQRGEGGFGSTGERVSDNNPPTTN